MGYYGFQLMISRLKSLELELDVQFEEIIHCQNELMECVNMTYQWVVDELKYLIEIKNESLFYLLIHNTDIELMKSHIPSVDVNSLEDVLDLVKPENWIEYKDGIVQLDEESSIIVYKALEMIKNQRFENLCINKLNLLKNDLNILKQKLFFIIKTIKNDNQKDVFTQFLGYLKEFQYESNKHQGVVFNSSESIPMTVDWHPFHNDKVRDFYLLLESKNTLDNKIIFSVYWKFLKEYGLIDIKDKQIKPNYIKWINERLNLKDEDSIKELQTNIQSYDLEIYEKYQIDFEVQNNFTFHDFRDGKPKREVKK